jgi:putative Mn2+ efflux pump MntP
LTSPQCTKNSVTDSNEKTQSKIESLVEVFLNTLLGFAVSFSAWPFVAAAFDLPYSVSSNLGITACFTALSIARGYVVRRFFNEKLHRAAQALTRGSN